VHNSSLESGKDIGASMEWGAGAPEAFGEHVQKSFDRSSSSQWQMYCYSAFQEEEERSK